MATVPNQPDSGLKLQTICSRLGMDYDEARYLLAKGVLPKGVEAGPGKGNHRVFDHHQTFILAIIFKLKSAGVSTTIAKNIADWSRSVQGMSVNLSWDWRFAPFAGKYESDCEWYFDVGDARFARIVTNACPSKEDYEITPWVDMTTRREHRNARPAVVFRVDVVRIAKLLAGSINVD